MRALYRHIAGLLLQAVLLAGFAACTNDSPHEGERGLAVALDNSQCRDVAIGQVGLFVYDVGGNLCATYDYADAHGVALALLPLEAGHYTVATVINGVADPAATISLTSLHEWVEREASLNGGLLSGKADAEVGADGVTRVTLPLQRQAFSLPICELKLKLSGVDLSDFTPLQPGSRAAEAGYTIRCVVEFCRAGTEQVVLHKAITPFLREDGTYGLELQMSEGTYDMRLWMDFARKEAPLADTYYHTENLKAISIITKPYLAYTDAKDAAYGNSSGILVTEEGATVRMELQRPLAKYRIIADADELKAYLNMRDANPGVFPTIDELTVSVQYEGFFPSAYNALTGKPNDAVGGIAYTHSLSHYDGSATELELASDWIFVNGNASFVTATVIVSDSKGNVICRVPGVQTDYRRNELTTIRGRFLTSGANSGGVCIDTTWDGCYDVWF